MGGVLAGMRQELRTMAGAIDTLYQELPWSDGPFGACHPRRRALHVAQAEALERIVSRIGWPTAELVGPDAADAAWQIVRRSIARPVFLRRCLALLREAAEQDQVEAWWPAALFDQIRVLEGRQQVYGTQFDWDPDGRMSPCPIEDPGGVDARRSAVGLPPFAEDLEARRRRALEEGERPPDNWAEREREMAGYATEVGWR